MHRSVAEKMEASLLPIMFYEKGGSSPPPAPPDYEAMSRANIATQNNQARIDAENAARAKAEADAKHSADVEASRGRIASAYGAAQDYGRTKLGVAGLDPTAGYGQEILSLYNSSLDRARSGAPEVVSDANGLFSNSLYDDAYGTVRTKARSGLNKQANEFIGDGFENSRWSDTADDDILKSILDDQKTQSQANLDRALARGAINDVGYQTGQKTLGNQYDIGLAKANQTGLGVLSKYRQDLNDYAGNIHKKIDAFDFGDDINLGNYKTGLESKYTGQQGSLKGDILAAIGNTNYFDDNTILGKAGTAGGVSGSSTGTTNLGAAPGVNSTAGYLAKATDDTQAANSKTNNQSF